VRCRRVGRLPGRPELPSCRRCHRGSHLWIRAHRLRRPRGWTAESPGDSSRGAQCVGYDSRSFWNHAGSRIILGHRASPEFRLSSEAPTSTGANSAHAITSRSHQNLQDPSTSAMRTSVPAINNASSTPATKHPNARPALLGRKPFGMPTMVPLTSMCGAVESVKRRISTPSRQSRKSNCSSKILEPFRSSAGMMQKLITLRVTDAVAIARRNGETLRGQRALDRQRKMVQLRVAVATIEMRLGDRRLDLESRASYPGRRLVRAETYSHVAAALLRRDCVTVVEWHDGEL